MDTLIITSQEIIVYSVHENILGKRYGNRVRSVRFDSSVGQMSYLLDAACSRLLVRRGRNVSHKLQNRVYSFTINIDRASVVFHQHLIN